MVLTYVSGSGGTDGRRGTQPVTVFGFVFGANGFWIMGISMIANG